VGGSGNRIRRLPSEYGRLTALETLSLQANEIDEFPAALCWLPALAWVDLARNRLTALPSEILGMQARPPPAPPAPLVRRVRLERGEGRGVSD
jgi:Leucine-rich repeat (LRR) protein